jgi:4-hydroxybenzoate polyprenyltransferase
MYCLWLKRLVLVDVFVLSGMYILRIQGEGDAASVAVSEWLLVFSLFFFLSLAFAKRFVELDRRALAAETHDTGRGYQMIDIDSLMSMGTASGYIAVLVLALYINSTQASVLYARPKLLYLLCPLVLFWITRVWLLARRNQLHDDPVVFALKDRTSQAFGLLSILVVVLACVMGT